MSSEPRRHASAVPVWDALESRLLFVTTELVADIDPNASSNPLYFFRSSAGDVYYTASNGPTRRLYVTGGTPERTAPFATAPAGYAIGEVDGRILVRGESGASRFWTTSGAVNDVRPFAPGLNDTGLGLLGESLVIGSDLYVSTYAFPSDAPHTARLWKAAGPDGSSLTLLLEYQVNYTSGPIPAIQSLTNIDGQLYFAAKPEAWNYQVCKTDGTPWGTTIVARIAGPAGATAPQSLTRSGGHIFFRASGPLWRTDGTQQGTGPASSAVLNERPELLPDGNGGVYFVARSAANPAAGGLYRTDGSTPDATLVAATPDVPGRLVRAGGTFYMTLDAGLWASDGTAAGTRAVLTASGHIIYSLGFSAVEFDGMLYFPGSVRGDDRDTELWRTDGTRDGTVMVHDIRPGPQTSDINFLIPLGDVLYYRANDGVHGTEPWRTVAGAPAVTVAGRHVFYNNSAFDGRDPAPTADDLAAVAPDKQALQAGQATTFANVTSYSRGINGVLVDFAGVPPQPLTADDFAFRVRGVPNISSWAPAPPASVAEIPSPAGANVARYAITWPDGAVRNGWLEVTIKAGARTGLGTPDVFYFGNLVAETGNNGSTLAVTGADVLATRAAVGRPSGVAGRFDFNRDGRVNAIDVALVREAAGRVLAGPFERAAGPLIPASAGLAARLAPLRRSAQNPLLA